MEIIDATHNNMGAINTAGMVSIPIPEVYIHPNIRLVNPSFNKWWKSLLRGPKSFSLRNVREFTCEWYPEEKRDEIRNPYYVTFFNSDEVSYSKFCNLATYLEWVNILRDLNWEEIQL
jgi:hypothetical protein